MDNSDNRDQQQKEIIIDKLQKDNESPKAKIA